MKTSLISGPERMSLLRSALLASLVLAMAFSTRASLPNTGATNLSVVVGSATYPALGNGTTGTLTISASTAATVLGWGNFSDGTGPGGTLGVGDTITFSLPSSASAILNQVSGGAATTINGAISSIGKVFILNPAGITLGATSSVNAAGFYASTVPETFTYFGQNGNLQVFTASPPATPTTGPVAVKAGAQLATSGGTGTIGLAGATVTVDGLSTAVTGNLYVETQAPAVNPTTTVILGNTAAATTIGAVGAGGNLTIVTNGGSVNLAQSANVTITGAATINTASGAFNGNIATTNLFSATTAGTLSTINAGTGATGGTVNLSDVDFASIGVTGHNVTIADPNADTVAVAASTINGTLSVTSTGGGINTTGAVSATGNVSLDRQYGGEDDCFQHIGQRRLWRNQFDGSRQQRDNHGHGQP